MPLSNSQRMKNITELIYYSTGTGEAIMYLALSSTLPNGDGTNVTEPSGNGYERISMKTNLIQGVGNNFPASPTYDSQTDKYSITNQVDMYFKEATGSWGTLPYFAIFSSKTGGTMVAYGSLASAISPVNETIPVLRAGNLTISED